MSKQPGNLPYSLCAYRNRSLKLLPTLEIVMISYNINYPIMTVPPLSASLLAVLNLAHKPNSTTVSVAA